MQTLVDVLQGIANNVFGEVAILIGLITLLGLVLQRKPVEEREARAATFAGVLGLDRVRAVAGTVERKYFKSKMWHVCTDISVKRGRNGEA
jgi:ascorbate-specific PTS system EIIC-type component UlaA